MKRLSEMLTAFCLGGVLLTGCAIEQRTVNVQPIIDEDVQVIKMGGLGFEPNTFIARQGDTVLFVVENISGSAHNFSLKDPSGRDIMEVDIPAKDHARVRVTLMEPGTYEFYCNKSFHAMVGMSGTIKVPAMLLSENLRQAR